FELGRDFEVSVAAKDPLDATGPKRLNFTDHVTSTRVEEIELGVHGAHQANNAAIALATIARLPALGFRVSESAMRSGLSKTRLPGRVEVLNRSPDVVLDTAHNVASVQALLAALDEISGSSSQQHTLIYATSDDKDVRGMLKLLTRRFDRIVLTRFQTNPRAADPCALGDLVGPTCEATVVDDPRKAWRRAYGEASSDSLICVAGSFFLAAELRPVIVAQFSNAKPAVAGEDSPA
ncbi:MAG: cyanophycin synthetase, partial [Pirellulaceae bacterium]|nr:cyanophycin synthetase [Pirellulaceae bacterium]